MKHECILGGLLNRLSGLASKVDPAGVAPMCLESEESAPPAHLSPNFEYLGRKLKLPHVSRTSKYIHRRLSLDGNNNVKPAIRFCGCSGAIDYAYECK